MGQEKRVLICKIFWSSPVNAVLLPECMFQADWSDREALSALLTSGGFTIRKFDKPQAASTIP